jgi:uncharacterized protein YdeI (YjbR/CyaY-like superfamily)
MENLLFKTRSAFRTWLTHNALSKEGVWLQFGKNDQVESITAAEALEEALCFGWIDGQMKSIDNNSYIKYFKQRNNSSAWSDKNKKLADKLEANGQMTDFGRAKIEYARKNGHWDLPKREPITEEQMRNFEVLLQPHEPAWTHYINMPPSARRPYLASYIYTKTDAGKQKRLATIIERLHLNLNPMESMKKNE